jgi:3-phenylpropionate/trans-cinnamate dioxygenase ferredoxin reductase subunit
VSGSVDAQGTDEGNTVLACQAIVSSNAEIEFEPLPLPAKRIAVVTEINTLSPKVLEVIVATTGTLDVLPGQYVRVKFAGFPAREYSPTFRLDGSAKTTELIFHIRCFADGVVSSELGRAIKPGSTAHVQGPFGRAYLRKGTGPLILVAGGTGWAPIWSLARSACLQHPRREMIIIAGSRHIIDLYMRPSLDWLLDNGVRELVATAEVGATDPVRSGLPTHYLPLIGIEDTVYAAGPAGLVNAVKSKARAAHARCYADAFLPSVQSLSMLEKLTRRLFALPMPSRTSSSNYY